MIIIIIIITTTTTTTHTHAYTDIISNISILNQNNSRFSIYTSKYKPVIKIEHFNNVLGIKPKFSTSSYCLIYILSFLKDHGGFNFGFNKLNLLRGVYSFFLLKKKIQKFSLGFHLCLWLLALCPCSKKKKK